MKYISPYLLLGISVIISMIYCIIRNNYSKKYVTNNADYYGFNCLSCLFSALIIVSFSGGINNVSAFTVCLGILFGIATAGCLILNLQALSIGPMSYTTVILSASMIMPSLSGAIFWGESVSLWQYIGLVLILASLLFAVDNRSGEENKRSSMKWLLMCIGAFLFNGSIGIMQKVHQSSVFRQELKAFLLIAFLTSAILSATVYGGYSYVKKRMKTSFSHMLKWDIMLMAAVSGIGLALVNKFNLYLSGVMDSVIFFPVINGGNILLSILVGVAFLKEKLTLKQWAGLLLGSLSILLLCNIF